LGRYRVTARLGAGAFGVVYKAHDDELQREVAIKPALSSCSSAASAGHCHRRAGRPAP
jgi:hypothetical protein